MIYIIVGTLTAILGLLFLWYWIKHTNPFTPLFELGFLLLIFMFGYSAMFFCIGLFGDRKADCCENAVETTSSIEEYEDMVEEDTSTYIILKIDTFYVGRKYNCKGMDIHGRKKFK